MESAHIIRGQRHLSPYVELLFCGKTDVRVRGEMTGRPPPPWARAAAPAPASPLPPAQPRPLFKGKTLNYAHQYMSRHEREGEKSRRNFAYFPSGKLPNELPNVQKRQQNSTFA